MVTINPGARTLTDEELDKLGDLRMEGMGIQESILHAIEELNGSVTVDELVVLLDYHPKQIKNALYQLHRANKVKKEGVGVYQPLIVKPTGIARGLSHRTDREIYENSKPTKLQRFIAELEVFQTNRMVLWAMQDKLLPGLQIALNRAREIEKEP